MRKMQMSDVFVVLDDVQFAKNNRQNRNQIVGASGEAQWITVPVVSKGRLTSDLSTTLIAIDQSWRQTYLGRMHASYRGYPHFSDLYDEIEQAITHAGDHLLELNLELLEILRRRLGVTTPIVRSSQLTVEGVKSDRLVSILSGLGADTYIAGSGSRGYMELELFAAAGIEVVFNDYSPPVYTAPNGYIPGVSAVDVIFRFGSDARDYL